MVNELKLYIGITCLVLVLFAGHSCQKDPSRTCVEHQRTLCGEIDGKTNIRIKNISKYDFCNVKLSQDGNANYGLVRSQEATCYLPFDKKYHNSYIAFTIDGASFSIQPIDFVEETTLAAANYRYEVDIIDWKTRQLSLEAIRD